MEEIMDRVLDGTASAEERDALQRRLESDPDGRRTMTEWEAMFEKLRAVPPADPPPGLRHSIMRAVRTESAPQSGWRAAWASLVGRRPQLALAYATAFGVVAGSVISLSAIGVMDRDRGAPVSGTMAPPAHPAPAVIERVPMRIPDAQVGLMTTRAGEDVGLGLQARGAEPLTFTITFDPAELRVAGIAPLDDPGTRITVDAGRLEVSGSNAIRCEVRWTAVVPEPAPVVVLARSGMHEDRVTVAVTPGGQHTPRNP